jgi:hypothetical protein
MWITRRYSWILVLVAEVLGIGSSRQLAAQEVVLPEPVRNALGSFAQLKTFSASWSHQHQPPSGLIREKLRMPPMKPPNFLPPPDFCYLVWQGGKMYCRTNEGGREWKDAPNIRRQEFAFDGRILASGSPDQMIRGKRTSPELLINFAENEPPEADYFGVRYFEPLGIRLPHGVAKLPPHKHLASQVLFLLDDGGRLKAVGPAQIDGRPMTRIAILAENPVWRLSQKEDFAELERMMRSAHTMTEQQIQEKLALAKKCKELIPREVEYIYYLDPQLCYAVRRFQELATDGRLRVQSDCTEHQKLAGYEIWLARKCRIDYYVADGTYPGEIFDTPFAGDVLEFSEFGTKPVPDEQFTLRYTTPGTSVTDMTLPEAKTAEGGAVSYKVPANPEDLDRVIEEARALTRAEASHRKWQKVVKIVLIVGNAGALAGLVVYLVVRYRRKVAAS